MYKKGDVVVYRRTVCKVTGKVFDEARKEDFYTMEPYYDDGTNTKFKVPVSNKSGNLRDLISKAEVTRLLKKIPDIEPLESKNTVLQGEYNDLFKTGDYEDLVRIIKTTYLRNKHRQENKKKISTLDEKYFNEAESTLYSELSVVLGKTREETKAYVSKRVAEFNN